MSVKKAQVSMIAIVLILVVFLGLALFLTSTLQTQGLNERLGFYSNNLLLAFLKTDTGYAENPETCQTIGDLLHCSAVTPSFQCGGNRCGQEAVTLTDVYLSKAVEKSGFDYYFVWGNKESGKKELLSKQHFKATNIIERKGVKINVTLYVGKE